MDLEMKDELCFSGRGEIKEKGIYMRFEEVIETGNLEF